MQTTVLTTERLQLRVPAVSDAAAMSRFASDNREHHEPWSPLRDEGYFTPESWRLRLAGQQEQMRAGRSMPWIFSLRDGDPDRVVGFANLSQIVRGDFQAAYLGYGLDVYSVGKGFMHEALEAVLDHAFGTLNLHRVMANYIPRNERSARVLQKLEFRREGIARGYLRINGRWQDHILTSRTNHAWHLQ